MKSEKRKIDLIFRFRHCLAFVTIILFLLTYGFISEAAEGDVSDGTGSYTTTDNFRQSMGIEEGTLPYVDLSERYGVFGGTSNFVSTPACFGDDPGRYNDSSNAGNKFVTSVTVGNSTVTFPDNAYYLNAFCWNTASSQQWFYNSRISGSGHFAILTRSDNYTQAPYVVSDAPFVVGSTRYMAYFGIIRAVFIENIDTASANGLYMWCPYYPSSTSVTNLPIYIATTDGSSGYTTFTDTSTDFSFGTDNFDFNNLTSNGLVTDPNPPQENPDEVLPYASVGLNYIFGSVEPEFSTPRDGSFLATYNFHLNSYMLSHPEEYSFYMGYKIITTNTRLDGTFTYNHEITISDILFHNDQQFNENIDWYDFTSGNDNLGVLLRDIYTSAGNNSSSYTDGSVISYGSGNPGSTRTFGRFTAGVRNLYDNDITSFKFYYDCYFIWHGDPETQSGHLKGWKDLKSANNRTTQNDISTNYYPPSESDIANYPETPSSGNTTNNGGVFNDGDVYVYNNGALWTPYTLDQVSYGNVKDMFDDVKDFVDSSSSNSFWSVLTSVLKPTSFGGYIPDKIWEYITISVAVICGFAVVRYVLRR